MVIYELNEVPRKLFEFYANSHPKSAFARLMERSTLFETQAADVGELSPWITWPTMHRGVSNIDHEISDLGQDLAKVNEDYPSIHSLLASQGVRVGVFGSLQSYPLPKNLNDFAFYVPDTFAAGPECFPEELSVFQAFNLSMVERNARNVTLGIAGKDAYRFIIQSAKLGLTADTGLKLLRQLFNERINSHRLVRRRTSQVELAFDLYMRQLKKTQPDISFFFTNHLASSMHRYWPAIFPEDYEEGMFAEEWRKKWAGEIPHAIKVANAQLERLLRYADKEGRELIVCSSMGQAAVKNTHPVESEILITNIKTLMGYLGLAPSDWEPRLSMAPQVVVTPKTLTAQERLNRLKDISINGKQIKCIKTSTGEIRISLAISNQEKIVALDRGKEVSPTDLGIRNVYLQDAAASYAYHVPEGVLLHYDPNRRTRNTGVKTWEPISVLDFAPSVMRRFGKAPPSYMTRGSGFWRFR